MTALIDGGSSGGYDPEEARRKAILDRLARGDDAHDRQSFLERAASPGVPTSQPTVADRATGDAHDRLTQPSVLERNEQSQAGPFAGGEAQREERRFAPAAPTYDWAAANQAEMQRALAESAARNEAFREASRNQAVRNTPPPAPVAAPPPYNPPDEARREAQVIARGPSIDEQQEAAREAQRQVRTTDPYAERRSNAQTPLQSLTGAIRPGGEGLENTLGLYGSAIPVGGIARGIGGLTKAIIGRLGRVAPVVDDAARLAPQASTAAGRGFQIVGGAADDVTNGAQLAARSRSAAAAARQAAGTMDDASLAAARQATQRTPLGQAITSRLGRIPTPVKVAAGAGAVAGGAGLAGLVPGEGATPDQNTEVGQQESQNRPQGGLPQGPVLTPPTVQAPDGTATPGAPRASVNPNVEGTRGTYTPVPQYGSTPRVAPAPTPGAPTTPGTSPAARPPVTPAPGLRGGVAPIIERPGTPGAPIQGRGPRFGETPFGATPGQTPTGPTTGPVAEGPLNSEAMRQQVVADLNGIAQIINAGPMTPDVMALFASQGSKLIDLINEQEKQLRAQSEAEGKTIDPATQSTLDTLREQLGLQMKATKERLNSRGLLDSGILIEAEQMLVKGNLSDQAKILAERLSRITDNLNQGLGQMRGQRVQTATSFGMAGAQAQTQAELAERGRMDDLRRTLVSGRLGLGNSYASEEQAEMNRSFEAQQNDLARQSALAAKNAELAQRAGDAQAELRWKEWQAELDRENQRLVAEITQGGQTARQQPSGTQVDLSTNNVIAQIGSAPDRDTAIAAVQAAQSDPAFGTVDWLKVMQSIEAKWPQSGGFKWPWE